MATSLKPPFDKGSLKEEKIPKDEITNAEISNSTNCPETMVAISNSKNSPIKEEDSLADADIKQELYGSIDEKNNAIVNLEISEKENDTCVKSEEYTRISAHPDFLCVAQFIGTFGGLLGIPQFFIDTIEDGLNSSSNDINDEYVKACGTAVEQLLISLLRRCGVVTNIPKLSTTLHHFLEKRNIPLHTSLSSAAFNDLSREVKLQVLKLICLCQFDENCRFKTELNSQYSPDDLRFHPLGRDLESSQYWFISDREKSHRLYRWKYPYSMKSWSLLSATFTELQRVLDKLRPPESEHQLKQGKLWEIVNRDTVDSSPQNTEKKKTKKKKKKREQIEEIKVEDLGVEHKIRKYELGMRKSARNVNRKVYTETNEDNETSDEEEDEEEHKEHDEKYKRAVEIARSRKRSRKHLLTPRNKVQGQGLFPTQEIENNPKDKNEDELVDSSINFEKTENSSVANKNKDPFAFSDKETNSRHSSSSHCGVRQAVKNGVDTEQERRRTNFPRKPVQQWSNVRKEFIESIKDLPSLFNINKPAEAEDKCWKCKGEDNVDKMLFCDGCDLATYHMSCLLPPIDIVPEDDWLCPVCEQVLLFLKLRINLDKLRIFTYVPQASRSRARKSHPLPRTNTCRVRTIYRSVPRSDPSPNISVNRTVTYRPPLITPSRPVQCRYVTPRPRTKIGKIDRLSETARRVFDHYEEDVRSPLEHRVKRYKGGPYYGRSKYGQNAYLEDSESDCEVMYPDEVESDSSSDSEFSHRPCRGKPLMGQTPPGLVHTAEKSYTADDFLAEPPRSSEVNSKMGYNPLGASRLLCRPLNSPHSRHGSKDTAGILSNPSRRSSPNCESTCSRITKNHQTSVLCQPLRNPGDLKNSSSRNVDTATAIAEGRNVGESRKRVDDSRSGNVAMPNTVLSKEQQQALAAWEEDNKRRKDTFEFDD
ncbi:hypothetical protein ACHWQZ_G013066 [Mnemiopsis leidyi]